MKNKIIFLRLTIIIVFLLKSVLSESQVGGSSTYDFLNLVTSARTASLGGRIISSSNGDLSSIWQNPALLNGEMNKNIALSYNSLFAGAGYGFAAYAFDKPGFGTWGIGAQYVDYGTFRGADAYGNIQGDFFAKDFALNLSYSRLFDSIVAIGLNIKPAYSIYERYVSMGIAVDIGILYHSHGGNFSAALVLRNMGTQIKKYATTHESLPFEIMLGLSQKLQYAPFRFTLTVQHLETPDLYFDSQLEQETLGSSSIGKTDKLIENVLRHLIAGVEFLPSKTFYISAAYNHQRRKEMMLQDAPGMVGFSFGAGIRTQRFSICYGHSVYHATGGSDHFSILIKLGNLTFKQ
ncbi:MAG: type IX secretion system protein PorQ [Bacteroidales bacterium]|nr:type IX secretion system protein PorQ [Bacteroidales bacterium]